MNAQQSVQLHRFEYTFPPLTIAKVPRASWSNEEHQQGLTERIKHFSTHILSMLNMSKKVRISLFIVKLYAVSQAERKPASFLMARPGDGWNKAVVSY